MRLWTLALVLALPLAAQAETPLERGKYLVTVLDCGGCHSDGTLGGTPREGYHMAGSSIGMPVGGMGIFYPPNLTPDGATGLGGWSIEQIAAAVRTGRRPDGRELAPAMPWRSYALLSEADAAAIATYLKSLAPIAHKVSGPVGADEKPAAPYLTVVDPRAGKAVK